MVVIVCLALWLLYPRQDLEKRLARSGETALSIAYLDNLLRSDPDNPQLRLLLAQRQIAHGETTSARATLEPALQSNDPQLRRDALWALWELLYHEYQRQPAQLPDQRMAQYQALREHIRVLAQENWPRERIMRLAALASQFDAPEEALALSRQLVPENPAEIPQFYDKAAQEALSLGDYEGSAQLYLAARQHSTDPQQARHYYELAIRTLQAGNKPQAALALAEREIGPLSDDIATLYMLTELARAAGRPDIAEHYVRRLLHLALSLQWQHWQAHTALAPAAAAVFDDGASLLRRPSEMLPTRMSADPPPKARAPGLPFDNKAYTLGYEVFLENGKTEDAWAIAAAAVRQRPDDIVWRERLAQISEWTLRTGTALDNWLALAHQTDSEAAWQSVLRLAPGQFDEAALSQALYRLAVKKPDDIEQVRAYVFAQERLGEPEPAIAFLQKYGRTAPAFELLAQLAERTGQPALALENWSKLLALPGELTPERAMHAAVVALEHNQPDLGLQWLEAAQALPPPEDVEVARDFWRMTGGLAESREHISQAIAAYRSLIHSPKAELGDYDALIRLLLHSQPLEAAQVSLLAWEKFSEWRHLVQTLTIWSGRNMWAEFGPVLARIEAQPSTAVALRELPQFLRLVGAYHQNAGRFAQAQRYYEAGLRAQPDSDDMRQALLWLFIDSNDATSIRRLLALYEKEWSRSEDLHDSLASAYQALSLPQVALDRYLTPRLMDHQHDFLWLMNYADALDQNQQSDRAWRLRRHLLSQQWQTASVAAGGQRMTREQARRYWLTQEGMDATRRIARARLSLTQQPGDPALQVLRELLRLDQDAQDAQGNYSNAAAETAIGWLQDAGEYTAERGFLHHQYARSQSLRSNRPLWADITVALAEDDTAATGQLLEEFDARLPRYDRVNAAVAIHDTRRAQTAAFETSDAQHDDQPLHLQLTDNLLAFSDHLGGKLQYDQLGGMDEIQAGSALHLAISPRLSLDLELKSVRRSNISPDLLRNIPYEQVQNVLLRWRHRDGETQVHLGYRKGYTHTTPLLLAHEQRLDNRLSLRAEWGQALPSEDSLALRVAGMKTRASISLRYQPTRQDQFVATHWGERYQLQTGQEVGSGRHTSLQYTHTYRQDAPLLEWGAFGSMHRYERRLPSALGEQGLAFQRRFLPPDTETPGVDYFLPDNFHFYGLQLSTNMRFEQSYSRGLRPYALVSRTWHSRLGAGYGLRLGLVGSVLGSDHLMLGWGLSKAGEQSLGLNRNVLMTYRLHF